MGLSLFDLDGTLIDSEQGIVNSIEYALAKLDVESPSRASLRDWIGPPLRAMFPQVLGNDPATIERAVACYRERFNDIGWREHTVYPGIGEVIHALATRGDRLAVVTTKADLYAERIVRGLPFGDRFERVYAAAPASHDSEKAAMIAQALRDFETNAGDAVMVGDRRFDIDGARANGVRAIGAGWGFGSREELRNAGADAIAETVEELGSMLLRKAPAED
ncbi:MAG: HAD hydrolase-like protein [Dokdonella sp.]|uniref:HAD hydrolase-like protein n=1 Tax=Dokdonella sp. TaxID=2291710 RepID=UPI00326671A3